MSRLPSAAVHSAASAASTASTESPRGKPRILLIYPPFYRLFKDSYSLTSHPLGLAYLASAILKQGRWEVQTYNADFNAHSETLKHEYVAGEGFARYTAHLADSQHPIWDEIRGAIAAWQPSVVGICAKSPLLGSVQMVARLAKEYRQDTVVVMGGAHASTVGAGVLDCADVDIGVIGEGDETIVELLDALAEGQDLGGIKGLVYRGEGAGEVVQTPPRPYIEDLDALGFPHETAPLALKDYASYPRTAFQYVFATRGCPYGCFFCGSRNVWTRRVRFRSPESMTAEINSLRKQVGLRRVFFSDDTFGINSAYIKALCEALIRDCPGIRWGCETHAKVVTEENVALMKAAGCDLIKMGVESGNNEILKKIQKGITIEDAYAAAEIIHRHGIPLHLFFQAGYPWETEETLRDTVTAMKRIKSNFLIFSIFTPYPGTGAFEYCRQHGLVDDTFDISQYNHQSPANHFCLNIPPERFRVLMADVERMVDRTNHLRRAQRVLSVRNIYRRVREIGIAQAVRNGVKALAGR